MGGRPTFLQFFEVADQRFLLFTYDQKDELAPTLVFPPAIKKKSVIFVKKHMTSISMDNIEQELMAHDLSPTPLQQMANLIQDVYLPLLENSKNHESWPEVVSQDVKRHFHKLLLNISVALSQTKGETLLPLPPGHEQRYGSVETASQDKTAVHALESIVVDWIKQINVRLVAATVVRRGSSARGGWR